AAGACGFNGIPAFSATNSTVRTGYSVGGGVDVKLAGNWSARGEYRYSDYGTWRTVLGNTATLAVTTDIKMRTHPAFVGLAYTFAALFQQSASLRSASIPPLLLRNPRRLALRVPALKLARHVLAERFRG